MNLGFFEKNTKFRYGKNGQSLTNLLVVILSLIVTVYVISPLYGFKNFLNPIRNDQFAFWDLSRTENYTPFRHENLESFENSKIYYGGGI